MSEQAVTSLNKRAYKLTLEFIEFKEMLLNRVLDCSMFMATYQLLIDHITKEARLLQRDLIRFLEACIFAICWDKKSFGMKEWKSIWSLLLVFLILPKNPLYATQEIWLNCLTI